ncbi:unnamed protein product [Closterium sp. NIES-65]|nr:unnamed protein product [Closterium sp. NIES-65]
MTYKFHEDEHGEVIAEIRRSDMEPYLGLHYPATDIPQASRFLFMKNRVRMICDCNSAPFSLRVLSTSASILPPLPPSPPPPLPLLSPFYLQYMGNMGSTASLVMAVIINDNDEDAVAAGQSKGRKLWGLVVCHHSSPRYVPFPLRSACEFLMQVFGLQLNMEGRAWPLSCARSTFSAPRRSCAICCCATRPLGSSRSRPTIMDLVKCDGAALFYGGRFWLLGTTPTEQQIQDIASWLLEQHKDSTGLSTDSLADAGYPNAETLGNAVCAGASTAGTPRLSELTGLPVGEAMGRSLVHDLVHEESKEVVERVLYLALQGEEEQNIEVQLRTWGAQKEKKRPSSSS